MRFMFYRVNTNNNLRTVYVGKYWNTDKVSDSDNMFYNCANLKGGAGTTYNSDNIDKTYARIDGGTDDPGYLTGKYCTLTVNNAANGTVTADKTGSILAGETITLTVEPDHGYEIYDVKCNNTTIEPVNDVYSFKMPGSDATVTAVFAKKKYTVIWNNWDGTLLRNDTVEYGDMPDFGSTPTRDDDRKYSYTFSGWTPEISEADGNATYTAVYEGKMRETHFSVNAEGTEYTIHDATGWDIFCAFIEDGETFSGKTIILENNIGTEDDPITVMAGKSDPDDHSKDRKFEGTFDGNHKTITFMVAALGNYTAPFAYINGTQDAPASVSDLDVVTSITSIDHRHIAGLVAVHGGYVNISNCNAKVYFSAVVGTDNPSDLYPAGLVSQSAGGKLTITGCTVTGTISTNGKYAAGFVGILQGDAEITNCKSSVVVKSSVEINNNKDGTHGGFVAGQSSGTLKIYGCLFNGKLLTTNGTI